MKIRIISGTYGHREDGMIVAKTAKSEPFDVDDKRAKELIAGGIAAAVAAADQDDDDEQNDKAIEDMTKKELTELATSLGLELPKKATNQQIIDLIKKHEAEDKVDPDAEQDNDEDDEDNEDDDEGKGPDLSAQLPE